MATPMGLEMPVFAPRIERTGAILPCAVRRKTRTELSPLLATAISSCVPSRSIPMGQFSLVFGPWIVRTGLASPLAASSKTLIEGGTNWPPRIFSSHSTAYDAQTSPPKENSHENLLGDQLVPPSIHVLCIVA